VMANVHLRAGPSVFYPSVGMVFAGSPAVVFGCEQGFNWCDVQIGLNRGWVDAAFLQAQSPGGPVIITNNPFALGIPITPFVLNTYWNTWYRGRPWFAQRPRYYNYWRQFPHGRPPPPPRRPIVRPPARPPMVRPPARPPVRPPPANTRPPPGRPPAARPPAGRPSGDRPGGRPSGDRPPGGRPSGDRPSGGRPSPGNSTSFAAPNTPPAAGSAG